MKIKSFNVKIKSFPMKIKTFHVKISSFRENEKLWGFLLMVFHFEAELRPFIANQKSTSIPKGDPLLKLKIVFILI